MTQSEHFHDQVHVQNTLCLPDQHRGKTSAHAPNYENMAGI